MTAAACQVTRPNNSSRVVVIGCSAGGFMALTGILSTILPDFALPVLVVQHLHPDDNGSFARHLAATAGLPVIDAYDKVQIRPGHIYTAPANYHMLLEQDGTIALSLDEKVNWSRPSIDVLFESAARAVGAGLIAIILSGANADGAAGVRAIKAAGGLVLAQDPGTAEFPVMPEAAIATGAVDEVLPIREIRQRLAELGATEKTEHSG